MNYKDVFQEEVWFILSDKKREGRRFLQWAKELGCVWLNGREIEPQKGTEFFVVSVSPNGTLGYVPAFARAAKQFRGIKRVNFKDVVRRAQKSERAARNFINHG